MASRSGVGPAKAGEIPALSRNGDALSGDEPGRLSCTGETCPRRKGGSLDTAVWCRSGRTSSSATRWRMTTCSSALGGRSLRCAPCSVCWLRRAAAPRSLRPRPAPRRPARSRSPSRRPTARCGSGRAPRHRVAVADGDRDAVRHRRREPGEGRRQVLRLSRGRTPDGSRRAGAQRRGHRVVPSRPRGRGGRQHRAHRAARDLGHPGPLPSPCRRRSPTPMPSTASSERPPAMCRRQKQRPPV